MGGWEWGVEREKGEGRGEGRACHVLEGRGWMAVDDGVWRIAAIGVY